MNLELDPKLSATLREMAAPPLGEGERTVQLWKDDLAKFAEERSKDDQRGQLYQAYLRLPPDVYVSVRWMISQSIKEAKTLMWLVEPYDDQPIIKLVRAEEGQA